MFLDKISQRAAASSGYDLQHGCVLKRTDPVADGGTSRNSTPDGAAQIAKGLTAATNARHFHRPGRRAGVKARFTKTLHGSAQKNAGQMQRVKSRLCRRRAQLAKPAIKVIFRPRRSASGPEKNRLPSATNEKVPMTQPTMRSVPPKS